MASAAHTLYTLLSKRIDALEGLRGDIVDAETQESIYRACIVLTVSALDTYVHEKAAEVYDTTLKGPTPPTAQMSAYLGIPAKQLAQPATISLIRYRLSFKTLVTPTKIDDAIAAGGVSASAVWQAIGIGTGSRESRLRNSLQLQVDRRNQIAHEGDWDLIAFDFRHISPSHVQDCRKCIGGVVDGLDKHWIIA